MSDAGRISPFSAGAIGAGSVGAAAVATRFWWVRHAPVEHGGRIYGQKDMTCDCSDTAVFSGLARQLPREAAWVTSNLRRTHETARAIVRAGLPGPAAIPGPDAPALPDLAEQAFGDWQGLTYDELRETRGGAFHRFWHAPAHERAPGGESFVDVMARVARAIHALVERHSGRDVIAVAHGGTIRAALGLALGLDPEACLAFTMENCSVTRIDHIEGPGQGHGWRVITVNRPPR
ncbi:MAG TPA: histidine phosphatase family protein [Stellaceae bacterium]|nr:histidine phosphatase family protein [Stellaceae bacterium]